MRGRLDERIIRAGASISPLAVEAALLEHPLVAEATAVGLPHPVDGEHVGACVVPIASARPTPEDLRDHCARLLPDAAVPDRVDLVATLPRSALGKPRRATLRRQMLES